MVLAPFVESAMPGQHPKVLRPTHTFKDELDVTIAGVQIRLIHAPGETDDQLFVWLPEKKVLMPGDNVYKSFPNLYTLRGTHYRDVATWYKSIDAMLAFDPEFLAPSHTLPVSGKEEIRNILTTYRDAIQFVHDQTLRGINQGLTPDELVEVVKLPDHLRNHPYLQEYYGSVEWSVRSIFSGYMGWYDGNAADLYPPTLSARAEKMAKLAGGEEQLLAAAQQAVRDGDYAWALQLSDHLMRLQPDSESVQQLRADAARAMGFAAHNANARNVYLTEAFLLEGKADFDEEAMRVRSYDLIKAMPIKSFVESMGINLNPEYSLDREETLALVFTDVNESFNIHVRHGVAIISEGPASEAGNTMTTTSDIWLDIMAGKISLPGALATGDIQLEGGRLRIPSVLSFLSMFRS